MIDEPVKQKLLNELEKSGNVYLACLKLNIGRATYYRWKKDDADFRKRAMHAQRQGRENMVDIAEHALMLNVKDKKMDAIKYVLSNNSKIYKPKRTSKVILEHHTDAKKGEKPQVTYEDIILKEEQLAQEGLAYLIEEFRDKELPLKPDGSPILPEEYLVYERYIRDWQKQRERESRNGQ